jgi:YbbR domain-containing protein
VIIDHESIEKYAVYLPLSQHLKEGAEAGTRHAAGLGLSEVSDAFVIIVSEERGTISIAEHGNLTVLSSAAALKEKLDRFYNYVSPPKEAKISFSWLHKHLGVKVLSLVLACLLWMFFAYRAETIHRTFVVPVEWRNLPDHYSIATPKTTEARVSMSGSERSFDFDSKSLLMSLDLDDIHEGYQEVSLSDNSLINKPTGLFVKHIDPPTIRVRAYKLVDVDLPVKVRVENRLPDRLYIKRIAVENSVIRAAVPLYRKDEYSAIYTEPIDLSEITGTTTMRLKLISPELVQLPDNGSSSVKVTIEIMDKKAKR